MRPILKRTLQLIPLSLVITGLLSGCFEGDVKPTPSPAQSRTATTTGAAANGDERPTTVAAGSTVTTEPTAQTQAGSSPTVQPLLTLAVNNSRDAELYKGWPVLIEASLMHPDAMRSDVLASPITVGTQGKPWTVSLKVQAVNSKGEAQSWPLHLADVPGGAVTLDNDVISTIHLWLSPEESAAIAEGSYAITASLDTQGAASGWRGNLRSVAATVVVSKPPAKLSPDQESLYVQTVAAQDVVRGDTAQALAELNALLVEQPENIYALEFKGDLLDLQGKTAQALEVYNTAVKLFLDKNPDAEEPPAILLEKQHDMMDKLLAETK